MPPSSGRSPPSPSASSNPNGRSSPIRPASSHAHLVTLPIHNPTLAPPSNLASSSRSPLYGLPGVSTSVLSLSGASSTFAASPGPSTSHATQSETLAPHLASAEAHLGRMTLTAPDNMMRRRAQEKEKERKARKIAKKQGRAREAMLALATTTTSSQPSSSSLAVLASTSDSRPRSRPRTPQDGGSSSSSGRAPERHRIERPASASRVQDPPLQPQQQQQQQQQRHTANPTSLRSPTPTSQRETTVSRIPIRPRPRRTTSGPPAMSEEPTTALPTVAAPSRSSFVPPPQPLAARASLRRLDIYQEIARLGLPGAEALSEEEDQHGSHPAVSASAVPPSIGAEDSPPPFPEGSTRPVSPPRGPPAEGGEDWTSEDERRWIAYRRMVPDSPPPAFISDDSGGESEAEGGQERNASAFTHNLPQEISHSESITRSDSETSNPDTPLDVPEDRRAWEEDVQRGLTFEQRFQRLEMRRRRADRLPSRSSMDETATHTDSRLEQEEQGQVESGRTVANEAEAVPNAAEAVANQRSIATSEDPSNTSQLPSVDSQIPTRLRQTPVRASLPLPAPPMIILPPHTGLNTDGALTHPSLPHRSSISNRPRSERSSVPQSLGMRSGGSRHSVPTAIRPRPTSEGQSRFRNDASAAAERRRLAWQGATLQPLEVVTAPVSRSQQAEPSNVAPSSAPERDDSNTMPGAYVPTNRTEESDGDVSSSSEAEWEAETAAFEALRRATEPSLQAQDGAEDSSSDDLSEEDALPVLRSPMGRLHDALPKAPPPLALGRSRGGGLAYDASDSEDSLREDDESDSDDSDSGREGIVRVVNPRWVQSHIPSAEEDRTQVLRGLVRNNGAIQHTSVSSRDKRMVSSASSTHSETESQHPIRQQQVEPSLPQMDSAPALNTPVLGDQRAAATTLTSSGPSGSRATITLQRRPSTASLTSTHSAASLWQNRLPGAPQPPPRNAEVAERLRDLFGASLAGRTSDGDSEAKQPGDRAELPRPPSIQRFDPPRQEATSSSSAKAVDEQQTRREVLLDIARLQQHNPSGSSLAALERLLSDSLRNETADAGATGPAASSSRTSGGPLARRGAITTSVRSSRLPPPVPPRSQASLITAANLSRSGSFINPRSSYAPLPRQTRLPTITDATRHFPPARSETSSTNRHGEGDASREGEEAVKPRLPPRPLAGTRVSALLERFEGPRRPTDVTGLASTVDGPSEVNGEVQAVPVVRSISSSPPLIDLSAADGGPPSTSRRRPPPPPPPQALPRNSASPARQSVPAPALDPLNQTSSTSTESQASSMGFPRSLSYPHLFRTDSQQDRERRMALDALTRNEESLEVRQDDHLVTVTTPSASLARRSPPPLPIQGSRNSSGSPLAERRPLPLPPGPPGTAMLHTLSDDTRLPVGGEDPPARAEPSSLFADSNGDNNNNNNTTQEPEPEPEAQQYITDLEILASRLESNPSSSSNFNDIALIQDFLGPAIPSSLSPTELSSIPLGVVEVHKRRVTKEGKTKTKLACLGLRVDRCGICLGQFREGQGAYVLGGCLHAFHGRRDGDGEAGQEGPAVPSPDCAREWFRRSRVCPMCRMPALEEDRAENRLVG